MSRIDYYEPYESEALARQRKEQIEREYPPQGYGTLLSVQVIEQPKGRFYVVTGVRYSTCD